jgi:hypothetical protein
MTDRSRWKSSLSILAVVLTSAGAMVGLSLARESSGPRRPAYGHPELFGAAPPCSRDVQADRRARRAEQHGRFHAERYPYDPRDGIRAVLLFQEARSCYQQAGLADHARRAEQLASGLMVRIDVDYASSRLVLDGALAAERWPVALAELERLLRLTEHVNGHAYVEYLLSKLGKVTIRAYDPS